MWHESEFVTKDAFPGTPLAAFYKGDKLDLTLFYFDRNKVVQELRAKYARGDWVNGTLGQLSIATDELSSLTVAFVGPCQGLGTAWLVYNTGSNNQARVVYWNEVTDTWTLREGFLTLSPGQGSSAIVTSECGGTTTSPRRRLSWRRMYVRIVARMQHQQVGYAVGFSIPKPIALNLL